MSHLASRARSALALAAGVGVLLAVLLPAGSNPPAVLLFGQTPREFEDRRNRLREAAGGAVVLLTASPDESNRARYRAVNDLLYLTGVDTRGAALALLPEGEPSGSRTVLFVRQPRRAGISSVGGDSPDAHPSGIATIADTRAMWETLAPSLQRATTAYVLGPVGERAKHTEAGAIEERVRSINPRIEVRDARSLIHPLRVRKSPGEISNIRAAIAATIEGFRHAARQTKPGVTELALEGAILGAFRAAGSASEGFPCVIGSGRNSLSLHNDPTHRRMERGDTVVLDIGAEVNYYTADLTRTFPVGGRFTPRQREIYDLVRDVQFECASALIPGKTTWMELNGIASKGFRSSSLRARDRSGQERTMDRFFIHGVGHWLGMDVHDVGAMSGTIQPGSVLTLEPGIYIEAENIGIRIEDNFVVTDKGTERLSASLPTDAPSIERMMRGR